MIARDYEPGTVLTAGLWRMPAEVYHRDPAPTPSLSSGILRTILDESPMHAHLRHPRYGNAPGESARIAETGSAIHRLVLGVGQEEIQVLDYDDYRSKAAREERDAALAANMIPMLATDYADAMPCAAELKAALELHLGCPVSDCHRELVAVWQDADTGGWRRAMFDLVTPDLLRIVDLKTTQGSAQPATCVQRLFDRGGHLQAAHYLAGLDALDPENTGRRTFTFLVGEQEAPYAVSPPIRLSEGALTIAREQFARGCAVWDECVRTDSWPGYQESEHIAEPPVWFVQRHELEREETP